MYLSLIAAKCHFDNLLLFQNVVFVAYMGKIMLKQWPVAALEGPKDPPFFHAIKQDGYEG